MGKGTSTGTTPKWLGNDDSEANDWGGRDFGYRGSNPRSRPTPAPKPATNWEKKYRDAQTANNKNRSKASKNYRDLNSKYKARLAQDSANPNRNLQAAVIQGNESNTRGITSFNSMAENLTNKFNLQSGELTGDTRGQLNEAYGRYNQDMQGMNDKMGTADEDLHARLRGESYAGLDTGFANAGDDLQASLARRGLSNAGVGAQAMGDLAQDRMRAGAQAGVNAYTGAIDQSDARRTNQMNTRGNLYGAEQGNINTGYQMGMANLGQNYGNTMAVRGQALQNTLNNNQQRQANLMGFAQLGRGMAGMSQNYLGQAGSGYGNIGNAAGQTAIGIGGLNNNFNATQQQAKDNAKGSTGSIVGAGANLLGTGIAAFSDERLKENIQKVGEIDGIDLMTWNWNSTAKDLGINDNTFGVIAQNVLVDHPEAVMMDYATGFYKVDYHKLFEKDL